MKKTSNSLNSSVSKKEIIDFFEHQFTVKAEEERNRRRLMQRQLHEIIGDKQIIITENKK
jgi:hypothetical protein